MPLYVFISPSLIFKNDKIYFLSDINDFTDDFEKNTYYIDFKDINQKGSFTYKTTAINYEIITPTDNKNLFVHFNFSDEYTTVNIGEFIHAFQNFIFDINCEISTVSDTLDKIKYIMQ